MRTLGDYSLHCAELTKALREIGEGRMSVMQFGFNATLILLEADGMIKPIIPNGEFQKIELTDKGREFLDRGGYSEFKAQLREDLTKLCIVNYSDNRFFIPCCEDSAFEEEFEMIAGRVAYTNAFGRGYDFPIKDKERVLALFKEQSVEYFEI